MPATRIPDRTITALRWSLVALSTVMLLLWLITAKLRLHYPYSYNETGILESVRHIRAGLPLYAAPNTHFTPFLYTPVFFYVAALLARFTGETFVTLRLVSIFATLGCFGFLYALVRSETRRHWAAIAAVGCFASCYPLVLQWFDVGRVDMLYLFFLMAAMYVSRPAALKPWHAVLAGLLWVAAFQTKQGVLPIALLALVYDWQRPRRIVAGVAAFVLGLGASYAYLQHASGGWYRIYVFGLAGGFGYNLREALRYLPTDILGAYGIAVLLAIAAALMTPPRWRSPRTLFYLFGCVSMIAFTGYLRGHRGAGPNVLLPAYLWIAVLFGIALARLAAYMEGTERQSRNGLLALLFSAALIQLVMRVYMPDKLVPHAGELAERAAFEEQLRSIPGNVMVLPFPEYAVMAGKPSYADMEATGAIIEARNLALGEPLLADYSALLHSGTLSAVVTDRPAEAFLALPRVWMPRDFLRYYPLRVNAVNSIQTQIDSQPHFIYLPCTQSAAALKLDPNVDLAPCNLQK